MIEILDLPDSNLVGLKLGDTLSEDDFDVFASHLRGELEAHTTTRILLEIEDVEGWDPEEQWENLTFDVRHVQDLDKVAVVGDEPWERLLDKLELLFPMSQIQTYDPGDREEAMSWLRDEMDVPGIGPGSVPDPQAGAQDDEE